MKTSLFRYCLPTCSSKTFRLLQTKSPIPSADYSFCRPRLVFQNPKTSNYSLLYNLPALSVRGTSLLRLTTLSNFPGNICPREFKLINLYKNLPFTGMLRATFLNLRRQFTYSLYLLNVLSSPTFLRHLKTPSLVPRLKTPSFKISQLDHKLLFL